MCSISVDKSVFQSMCTNLLPHEQNNSTCTTSWPTLGISYFFFHFRILICVEYYLISLFKKCFIIYWSIVDLQCCVSDVQQSDLVVHIHTGSIPGSGRSPGGGHGNPLQCSCLRIPWTEEPGGLQAMGSQSQTWLSDLARIHISILFWIIFPHRLLQNIEQSSLNYTVGPCWSSVLYIVVCIWQFQAPSLSNFFPLVSISLFSRSVSLFLFCK